MIYSTPLISTKHTHYLIRITAELKKWDKEMEELMKPPLTPQQKAWKEATDQRLKEIKKWIVYVKLHTESNDMSVCVECKKEFARNFHSNTGQWYRSKEFLHHILTCRLTG